VLGVTYLSALPPFTSHSAALTYSRAYDWLTHRACAVYTTLFEQFFPECKAHHTHSTIQFKIRVETFPFLVHRPPEESCWRGLTKLVYHPWMKKAGVSPVGNVFFR
jgi:hypothetical protein